MNSTPQLDEQALKRANLLGFATQLIHASGVTAEQVPALYKRATAYIDSTMAKRAKVRDLVLAQFTQPKAA